MVICDMDRKCVFTVWSLSWYGPFQLKDCRFDKKYKKNWKNSWKWRNYTENYFQHRFKPYSTVWTFSRVFLEKWIWKGVFSTICLSINLQSSNCNCCFLDEPKFGIRSIFDTDRKLVSLNNTGNGYVFVKWTGNWCFWKWPEMEMQFWRLVDVITLRWRCRN